MSAVLHPFAAAAAAAVADALKLDAALFQVGSPPKPELGDFAVGCFPAARQLEMAPPKIAAQVVEAFEANEFLSEATAAGPFVNFRANRGALLRHLLDATVIDDSAAELIPTSVGAGKTICIDYSSPNISKHLAYHHIRSTVIGHALANLYRAVGYDVVGINHLGDWGTTHGMLLAAYKKWGAPEPLDITALNELYVRFRAAMKDDPALEEEGRAWFKKLEDGHEQARQLWSHFKEVSWAEFRAVYDQLGIQFELVKGESEYEDAMPGVLEMLDEKGLSTESEGALVVWVEGIKAPLMLKKKDGATLYATRDLAAAIWRWQTYHFERNLYVVDRGQGTHFKQLFSVLAMAGYDWAKRCEHISFGLIRLGGKKTGTRTGNVVLLKEVLAEAEERSRARIAEQNPDMAANALAETARMVGVGAVVFANLASQREKDVDFSWEDVLSVEGDSGPYIQYAHARCASILRKAPATASKDRAAPDELATLLTQDAEWQLALKLLDLGGVVVRAADSNEPHLLSRYLLDLCTLFSRWYTTGNQDKALRVLCDDEATRGARLALVSATREALRQGLGILGLQAPDVM